MVRASALPTRWRLVLVLLGWTLLTACGPPPPSLPSLADDARLLAFGDSLTFGTGAAAGESYPAVLQTLIGRQVVNAGQPGEVSAEGLRRLPGVLEQHRPQLVLLCHGGNDLLRRLDPDEMERNLLEMIRLIRDSGAAAVLLSVPRPALMGLSGAEQYARVARVAGVPLEDRVIPQVLADARLRSDRIHPNAEGYRIMAEAVRRLLMDAGALGSGE